MADSQRALKKFDLDIKNTSKEPLCPVDLGEVFANVEETLFQYPAVVVDDEELAELAEVVNRVWTI